LNCSVLSAIRDVIVGCYLCAPRQAAFQILNVRMCILPCGR
jgi:hypothetical protein